LFQFIVYYYEAPEQAIEAMDLLLLTQASKHRA